MRFTKSRTSLLATTLASLLSLCVGGSLTQAQTSPDGVLLQGRETAGTRGSQTVAPGRAFKLAAATNTGFKAPARGLPGRREGAGTRGPCPRGNKPLTALIPATNLGQTLSAFPTFFFYVPASKSRQAEFELLDDNKQSIYKSSFKITGEAGMVSISLPDTATLSPLAVGKDYKWQFTLTCQSDTMSDDLFVEGWVQRVEANPTLVQQLQKATGRDKVVLYAEAGLWYETLMALAELSNTEPNNPAIAADWTTMLLSVGLNKIASEPLIVEPVKK